MAPRGSCLVLGLLLRGALSLRNRLASPEADDIHNGKYYKQELGNIHNVQYYGSMKIGGQPLTVILDTGSFEIVVFSRNCPTCGIAAEFNEGASPTFKWGGHTQTHSYGSGSCEAKDGFDNLAIGTVTSEKQPLWIAVNCQIPILATAGFNVIAGMGPPGQPEFSANSQMKKIEDMEKQFEKNGEELPQELKKLRADTEQALQVAQGKKAMLETLGVQTFSHCLGKEPGSPGYLIWNDETRAGKPGVQQIPVAGNITWGVVMKDLTLKSDSHGINVGCGGPSCGAIIDSGTSLFALPTPMYNAVVMQLQSMGPSLDCSDLSVFPNLVMNLGGQTLRFPPSSYIGVFDGQLSKDVEDFVRTEKFSAPEARVPCQLLLMDLGPAQQTTIGPMVILGMPFFREYYTTFDLGQGRGDRSLLVSKASADCSPEVSAVAAARDGNLRYTPLTVDLSALRLPLWLRRGSRIGVAAV
mmetsp:Transcript_90755/g.265641  ORF Transcript_90755/g.265641 Transcript_90755/m.265641 type:complete len:469 (+) Transcript_90755:497-1903(+)